MAVAALSPFGARSLSTRLGLVWALTLASALVVGWLLIGLYHQSADARIGAAARELTTACDELAQRYAFYAAGWSPEDEAEIDDRLRADLTGVVRVALFGFKAARGGIWSQAQGPLTPVDARPALLERIRALNADAVADRRASEERVEDGDATTLIRACPLDGPLANLSAWVSTDVERVEGPIDPTLAIGLGALSLTVLGSAGLLTQLLLTWSRRLGRIEASLARPVDDPSGDLPRLAMTGERELDRMVTALNEAGDRLANARAVGAALARKAADAERLAAVGRLAAGLAHEIRNPIAAMRLKAENALASDDARRHEALVTIIRHIDRLDRLLGDLLRLTHRSDPVMEKIDLKEFLFSVAETFREMSERAGLVIDIFASDGRAWFDREQVARALGNLILNALQNTPRGGTVTLAAAVTDSTLVLSVADDGPGVAEAVRAHLFEPFVSGRAEGTGLGLSIVREIAEAHRGAVRLDESHHPGARFVLELPWRAS